MDCSTPGFPCLSLSPGVCTGSCPLSHVLLLLSSIFPSIRVFLSESALHIRCPKVLELQHQSFQCNKHRSTTISSRWRFYIPEYILRTGIAGSFGWSTVNFWQTSVMFSIATTSFFYIWTVLGGFQLFRILTVTCFLLLCR